MVGKSWLSLATEFKQPDHEARAIQKFFKFTVNKKLSSLREECGSEYEQVYDADDTLYSYAGKYVSGATPIVELLPLLFRDDLAKLVRAQYKDAPMNAIAAGFNECFRSKYQANKDKRTVHVGVGTGGWPRKKAKNVSDTTDCGEVSLPVVSPLDASHPEPSSRPEPSLYPEPEPYPEPSYPEPEPYPEPSYPEPSYPEPSYPEPSVPKASVPARQPFRPW